MQDLMVQVADWLAWMQMLYYGVDRLWLGIGLVGATLAGAMASRVASQSGLFWQALILVAVGVGVFIIFLAMTQINPVLFDGEDLARSQVSM